MDNLLMRRGAVLFITLSMCSAPVFASAQTLDASSTSAVATIQSQIQGLLAQLSTLRQQLTQLTGVPAPIDGGTGAATSTAPNPAHPSVPAPCPVLSRNLKVGVTGDDVKQLQQFLAQDPTIFQGSATGFFGAKTAQAVQAFQGKNGIATSTTGVVGPRTRDFFSGRCEGGVIATSTPHNPDEIQMPRIPDFKIGSTTLPALISDMKLSSSTMQKMWAVASSAIRDIHPEQFMMGTTTTRGPMIPVPPQQGGDMMGR